MPVARGHGASPSTTNHRPLVSPLRAGGGLQRLVPPSPCLSHARRKVWKMEPGGGDQGLSYRLAFFGPLLFV